MKEEYLKILYSDLLNLTKCLINEHTLYVLMLYTLEKNDLLLFCKILKHTEEELYSKLMKGFEKFNKEPFLGLKKLIELHIETTGDSIKIPLYFYFDETRSRELLTVIHNYLKSI